MLFIRNLKNIQHGSAVTIGNFDGMHLGHQHILRCVTEQAKKISAPATVILFEPQPQEFFCITPPARLSTLRDKLEFLRQSQIDLVVCLQFNEQFAQLSAEQFIQQILIDKLQTRWLMVGEDFRFGFQKQGNCDLLKTFAEKHQFTLQNSETIFVDGERVSSSCIRALLAQGDFQQAEKLLGRRYTMTGHVVYGNQRGRELGFPTANLFLRRQVSPLNGVFAVKIRGIDNMMLPAVANIGSRPTVDGFHRFLEVYIFDFNKNIYGQFIEVEFHAKLRDEKKFNSLDELKLQIAEDVKQAREKLL